MHSIPVVARESYFVMLGSEPVVALRFAPDFELVIEMTTALLELVAVVLELEEVLQELEDVILCLDV